MTTQDYNFTSRASGGGQHNDWRWSWFMNTYNIGGDDGPDTFNISRTYAWSVNFNNYGKQKFYAVADDDGYVYIKPAGTGGLGAYQFSTGWMGHQTSKTTPGYFAPGVYTVTVRTVNSGSGPWGVAIQWYGFDAPPLPTITSFYAIPEIQNSSNGIPQYSTTLSFNSSGLGITSANINGVGVGSSGTSWINDLPQSNANGTSPAQRNYTFTVCNNRGCVSSTITVKAYNDNTPSNDWTTSFTNLDPNTMYTKTLGTLAGVDMPTTISTSGSNFVGKNGSFGGSINFNNGDIVQLRTTSSPFNTSMSGVDANATLGNTNSKTVPVTTPSGTFNVTFTTRAPVVKEVFDYADNKDQYPHEDIDLITNNPQEFTTSSVIEANDIEIAQEIKVDKPDAQVRINNDPWQDVRSM